MSDNEKNSLNSSTRLARQGCGGRGTPYNGLYWEAPLKRDTFFRPQVYERVSGISLMIVVYQRNTESVVSVNKGLRDAFYGCEKVKKLFWFCNLFIYLR